MIIIKTYWKTLVIVLLLDFLLLVAIICVIPMDYSTRVGLATVVISLNAAFFFGDFAGTWAARRFQEEDVKKARHAAFQSLINAVSRIRMVVERYQSPDPGFVGFPRLPVTEFQTAFVSGSPSLPASKELVNAVNKYLVQADGINSMIEFRITSAHDLGIKQACTLLPPTLDEMEEYLRSEKARL